MQHVKFLSILLVTLMVSACAAIPPQVPVDYAPSIPTDNTLSISTKIVDKVQLAYPGADCLLCLGAAAIANGGLASRTKELTNNDLDTLASEVAEVMKKHGYQVTQLETSIKESKLKKAKFEKDSDARRSYQPLKDKLKSKRLLVMEIDYTGFMRDYASYIPKSSPYAIVSGKAYLVNLENNQYEWYLPINEINSVGKEWKEGPEYPGLTNSFYQSIATVKNKILSGLSGNTGQN